MHWMMEHGLRVSLEEADMFWIRRRREEANINQCEVDLRTESGASSCN